jgi:alanine dehydrogenase
MMETVSHHDREISSSRPVFSSLSLQLAHILSRRIGRSIRNKSEVKRMMYLNEAAVHALLKPADLVDVLREALVSDIHCPQRVHHHIPGSDEANMLLMPAWNARAIGVKVLTLDPARTKRGFPSIDGLYLLMDAASGAPLAAIGARALTAARTAAVSALAASYLARPDASTLLMIGTGALAPSVIEAHCSVRNYRRVLIWGREREKAEAVQNQITTNAEVEIVTSLNKAIASADVITCATSSRHPLVHKRDVKPGTHVDLIGSYTATMREADNELFRDARVIVDTKGAILESGDLLEPCVAGTLDASTIHDLPELIRNPALGRRDAEEITIFKAAGNAAADLAAAVYLVARRAASQPDSTEKTVNLPA